jgi:UDP-N-acetylglucosamine--N-acetylmuramyl-(pentapeptide) pyrophosphoryl-undecaprenol N-acetylglucosamine transferase
MRVLITGGHFSPAYAVISELKKRGHEVAVAGRRYPFEGDKSESYEYAVTKKEKIEFFEIKTGRFQRKLTAYTLSSLLKTPAGFIHASTILRKYKPDGVLTFGGYIGLPIARAAGIQNIPVVLHEQTQKAGLASKAIAKIAKKVCISFESSKMYFPQGKIVLTGNPIREDIFEVRKKINIPTNLPLLYITGGSTGSHFINECILGVVEKLLEKFVVIHQTGGSLLYSDYSDAEEIRNKMSENIKKRYILKKFIGDDEIGFVFKNADLILARAGANTILEIMASKKIALLIPLPHGQTGEQLENATLIKNLGIGDFIEQKDADSRLIMEKLISMLENREQYMEHMNKTTSYVVKNAQKNIADIVEEVGLRNG